MNSHNKLNLQLYHDEYDNNKPLQEKCGKSVATEQKNETNVITLHDEYS